MPVPAEYVPAAVTSVTGSEPTRVRLRVGFGSEGADANWENHRATFWSIVPPCAGPNQKTASSGRSLSPAAAGR